MAGHRPFSELTKDFSPQRNARVEAETKRLLAEMALRELGGSLDIQQDTTNGGTARPYDSAFVDKNNSLK